MFEKPCVFNFLYHEKFKNFSYEISNLVINNFVPQTYPNAFLLHVVTYWFNRINNNIIGPIANI